jgi:hypothetical protein
MFFLLFPAGIDIGNVLVMLLIQSYRIDSGISFAPCVFIIVTPMGVVYGAVALIEAIRKPGGQRAFMVGAAWNIAWVGVLFLLFYLRAT